MSAKEFQHRLKLGPSIVVMFTPDSSLLLATSETAVVGWAPLSKERLFRTQLRHPSHVDVATNQLFAVKTTSGATSILSSSTGEVVKTISTSREGEGSNPIFSGSEELIVDGSWDGVLTIRNIADGSIKRRYPVYGMVAGLTSPANRAYFLFSVDEPPPNSSSPPPPTKLFRRFFTDLDDNHELYPRSWEFLHRFTLSPSARWLAVVYGAPPITLELVDFGSAQTLSTAKIDIGGVGGDLAWASDECTLGLAEGRQHSFFSVPDLRRLARVPGPFCSAVAFSPDGQWVAGGSWSSGWLMATAELRAMKLGKKVS
jgi:hypothetical protein